MIHICDAIMGSGKSQAAIAFMNAHPERKFIYLSPYLPEAERIYKACPALRFVQPGDIHKDERKISKVKHTHSLLSAGRNVASTHAAFCLYSDDMIELIQQHDYTLIIDESITTLTDSTEPPGDIQLLEKAGCIRLAEDGSYYEIGDTEYTGIKHRDVIDMCQRKNLLRVADSEDENPTHSYYYWELRSNILQAFSEVFILT